MISKFLKLLFPSLIWKFPTKDKKIYLTFDDGPIPEVTPWVLKTLGEYNAKATFFCVGENVKKHPDIFKMLRESPHAIGNHTMNHLNGWKVKDVDYFLNISECSHYVKSKLFRPPYGKIKRSQIKHLKNEFNIIMWDVLSKDYDQSLSGEHCFENVKKKYRNGSIIVFHDSLKADARMRIALSLTLKYFSEKGYRFESIEL